MGNIASKSRPSERANPLDLLLQACREDSSVRLQTLLAEFRAATSATETAADPLLDVQQLVNVIGEDGDTPLAAASRRGNVEVVHKLISHGANVGAANVVGETPLHVASRNGHIFVVRELLQCARSSGSDIPQAPPASLLQTYFPWLFAALFDATPAVDAQQAQASRHDGTSAVQHDRTLQTILETADIDGDTPMIAAARAGHFAVASALVDAGACVHTRAADGETLLTCAARRGDQRFASKLVNCGWLTRSSSSTSPDANLDARLEATASASNVDDSAETSNHETLLSATLKTLTEDAERMHEFAPMWRGVVCRLREEYALLDTDTAHADSSGDSVLQLVLLMCQLIRLKPACSTSSVFARLSASQTVASRLRDLQTEMSFMERAERLASASTSTSVDHALKWETQFAYDEFTLLKRFQTEIESLARSDGTQRLKLSKTEREVAPLLQHKVAMHASSCSPKMLELLETCLRIVREDAGVASLAAVPVWFIPEHDLDIASTGSTDSDSIKLLVRAEWNNAIVVASQDAQVTQEAFIANVKRCIDLNHPNVVKLFGASHLRPPFVAVFENAASTSLHEFLKPNTHAYTVWQKLLEVAHGLAFLLERGIVVETIRCADVWVGTNGRAKVNMFSCLAHDDTSSAIGVGTRLGPEQTAAAKAQRVRWKAPECIRGAAASQASLVYSFAMCVVEALTGEIPWGTYADDNVVAAKSLTAHRPSPPAGVSAVQRNMLIAMWAADPTKRPSLSNVCRQLEKFAKAEQQAARDRERNITASQQQQPQSNAVQSLEEHRFLDLGATLPRFLTKLARKCEWCEDHVAAAEYILARARNVFAVLQMRNAAVDSAAVTFLCDVLMQFDRFLRFADRSVSMLQCARSQRAALRSNVFHERLDELLLMLAPLEHEPIHDWRRRVMEDDVAAAGAGLGIASTDAATAGVSASHVSARARPTDPTELAPVTIARFPNERLAEQFRELDFDVVVAVADAVAIGQTQTAAYMQLAARHPWLMHTHELKYNEGDRIGQGAFGEVLRATWRSTPVVIKFMGYEDDESALSRELFFHELRVWFPLNHPHVAKLFGACHVGKRFFACEFVGGGTLDKYLQKQRDVHSQQSDEQQQHEPQTMSTVGTASLAATTWRLLLEVALGLKYMHDHNVLHNDLKCDNVLIDAGSSAKLIDFGLSCILDSAEVRVASKHMGAVQWKSPEYLFGGDNERLTLASDVYAFAMLMLEAVSGNPPWGRNTIDIAVKFHVKKSRLPPRPASMSAAQWRLVEMMCVREPAQRVQMAFVVDKLREFAQQAQRELEASKL